MKKRLSRSSEGNIRYIIIGQATFEKPVHAEPFTTPAGTSSTSRSIRSESFARPRSATKPPQLIPKTVADFRPSPSNTSESHSA